MSKERGKNVLLYLSTVGSPQSYTKLAGQRSTKLTSSAGDIDTTDKDSDNWAARLNGVKDLQVVVAGVANWPDTAGIAAMQGNHANDLPIDGKVILNAAGIYYEASWIISSLEVDGPHDGMTSYSATLSLAGTPYHTP